MIGRTILGRYEIQRLLGEGGMGRVFLARQLDLGRQVVVKVMHDHIAADQRFCDRFQRETLLMARFHHPYAVTLYDAALKSAEGSCIVMEYVKGGNLEALLEKVKKMTPPRVVRILTQLCEVLQAAHDEGIIHRDLKPANLMVVDPDTPKERIKVMDFGLAKLVDDYESSPVTDTNVDFAVGTPAYICPEQVQGVSMDHRGDLYSVGVMAFELLAGRVPFKGTSGMDVLLAHATDEPPTFASLGLGNWVPASIEAVVRKCMAKDPKHRYQSAKELSDAFNKALTEEQLVSDSRPVMAGLTDTHDDILPLVSATVSKTQVHRTAVPEPTQQFERMESALVDTKPMSAKPGWEVDQSLTFQMEAWMPESIAIMKLRGYVRDHQAAVLESTKELIRIRIGKAGWFNRRANGPVDLELRLEVRDAKRPNQLNMHVTFVPTHPSLLADDAWRARCTNLFMELRAYLMGGVMV